jgi:hypothetical protein
MLLQRREGYTHFIRGLNRKSWVVLTRTPFQIYLLISPTRKKVRIISLAVILDLVFWGCHGILFMFIIVGVHPSRCRYVHSFCVSLNEFRKLILSWGVSRFVTRRQEINLLVGISSGFRNLILLTGSNQFNEIELRQSNELYFVSRQKAILCRMVLRDRRNARTSVNLGVNMSSSECDRVEHIDEL